MTDEPNNTTAPGTSGGSFQVNVPATGTTTTTKVEPKPEEKPRAEIPAEVEKALKKANKEAESLRLKLKEIEDKDKSEVEKLREELEAAKRDADTARKDALRLKVGTAKGLPEKVAARLQGDTEEEMAADADSLLEELKPGKPRGDIDLGPRGQDPADSGDDMDSLLRAAARGR